MSDLPEEIIDAFTLERKRIDLKLDMFEEDRKRNDLKFIEMKSRLNILERKIQAYEAGAK